MTRLHERNWQQLMLVFTVWSVSTAGDSPEKIQSFMLSTDEEINEGIPLVINCNADVVMLPVKYNTIEKVTIKRRLHGSRDFGEIVTYDIYSVEEINKPEDRHWTFVSSGAPPDPNDFSVIIKTVNSRAINIEWTLHDASCADAGVYECKVVYRKHIFMKQTASGQQNILRGGAQLSLSPQTVKNEYEEKNIVTLTCTVDGPRKSTIAWGLRKAGAHSFIPVTDGVVTEDPVVLTDTECDPRLRYKSSLLVQVTKDYDGSVFKCYGVYDNVASKSANITLHVFQDVSPEIIQPSKLSTNEEINEGRPLVINCNADVVMVPAHYTTIVGVIIKRRLYGSKDFEEIVNYGINLVEKINKPKDRHWTFVSSGAPPGADQLSVRSAQLNSRAINVEWTLHDVSCADAGVYGCKVAYFSITNNMSQTYGQQNILRGCPPGVPRLSPSPHTVNNEYLEMDKVTFTCTVDGPRNSTIEWGLLKAGAHSFLPVTDGVVTEDPAVMTDTEYDPRLRYKSSLLVQVTKDYDGSVFKCYGVYDNVASKSANITLHVFQDVSPEIIQPSKLSTDEEINEGRPLVINCNADVVMVPAHYTTIVGVIIKRRLYGSKDFEEIVNYGINLVQKINNPEDRHWTFLSSGAPPDADPSLVMNAQLNSRAINVEWTLHDASCADAGVYGCKVAYFSFKDNMTQTYGQQNILRGPPPAPGVPRLSPSPHTVNNEYLEMDNVTFTCTVDGPRKSTIAWSLRKAGAHSFLPVTDGVVTEDSVVLTDTECDPRLRYKSSLLVQVTKDYDGSVLKCYGVYDNVASKSANITLHVFQDDSPEIIQLSKLSTDEEINQGRLLVINCNADVVMVPDYYTTITGVIIKRRLYGNKDFEEIVNYGINSADVINKPKDRHWTFVSSGALPDADQSLVKSTKVNSRAINVEWTLHDASCADAGVYECQVGYFIDMRKMEKTYGQQHILPGPPVPGIPQLSLSPQTVKNEYEERDILTLTCTVDGPRNSTIEWGLRKAGAHSFLPVTDGVVTEDPVVLTDTECDPRLRYKSSLLVQVKKDYEGSVFKCYGVYDYEASLSANITLHVSQDATSVQPPKSVRKSSQIRRRRISFNLKFSMRTISEVYKAKEEAGEVTSGGVH